MDVVIGRGIDALVRLLTALMALALAVMVVLVFANVVMRYAANSGIVVSEELSRWLFVWMTYLGAVVGLHERSHLGVDMLTGRLSPAGQRFCALVGHVLMLWICLLLVRGTWDQVLLNLDSTSAVMPVSMAWFHAAGLMFSVLGGLILFYDLVLLLRGRPRAITVHGEGGLE